jgi:hypothetical protein
MFTNRLTDQPNQPTNQPNNIAANIAYWTNAVVDDTGAMQINECVLYSIAKA